MLFSNDQENGECGYELPKWPSFTACQGSPLATRLQLLLLYVESSHSENASEFSTKSYLGFLSNFIL